MTNRQIAKALAPSLKSVPCGAQLLGLLMFEDGDFPLDDGCDARLRGEPFDPNQTHDWKLGWHDADCDLRARAAFDAGEPCPVCEVGFPCVFCSQPFPMPSGRVVGTQGLLCTACSRSIITLSPQEASHLRAETQESR